MSPPIAKGKPPAPKPQAPKREDQQIGLLSGVVGHELNNIAGALQGFTEIALHSGQINQPVREYLGEMRIAIGRIQALAYDLQSLGEFESIRTRVPIADCIPETLEGRLQSAWTIDWRCPSATLVEVDPLHARRALEALAHIGQGERAPVDGEFCVTEDPRPDAHCVTCGAPIVRHDAHKDKWVDVRVRSNARITNPESLRDPFGAAQTGRMITRLTLAALVHSAHAAGGHLLIDEEVGALSLVLPTASPG
jgi:hypothetical protein